MFAFKNSWMILKLYHIGPETRSLGQVIAKPSYIFKRSYFLSNLNETFVRLFAFVDSWAISKLGHCCDHSLIRCSVFTMSIKKLNAKMYLDQEMYDLNNRFRQPCCCPSSSNLLAKKKWALERLQYNFK